MNEADIAAFAEALETAERTRRQTRALSVLHPSATIDDAYAIQRAWIDRKLKSGRTVRGHKIGLTSKAMQLALGIDTPDSGFLLDDMFFDDGATVPCERFIGLRIEAELAFVMKTPLAGATCTMFDVLNATDFVTPALEILDTRIFRVDPETKTPRKIVDTIADNAADAGVVLGGRPFRPTDHDMRWIGAIVSKNGAVEETGLAAGVLNNPAHGIAWLVRRLAARGEQLKPGDVVLAGSFIRPIDVARGDTIVADYGAFGTVSCHFG